MQEENCDETWLVGLVRIHFDGRAVRISCRNDRHKLCCITPSYFLKREARLEMQNQTISQTKFVLSILSFLKQANLFLDSRLLLSGTQLLFVASCHLPSGGQVLLLHMKLLPDIFCHHFPIK